MPNPIKYSTGSESLALKKGNFYIGTGDVGKGPSDTTGYYQGPSVPPGGYVIYLYNSSQPGDLSYHTASNDAELISFTNNLAGTSYTTVNECLVYYVGQTDKVCFNRDYEGVITDGLIFYLDAGFTPSFPRSGVTWYDVSVNTNNGILTNGPIFSGNSIVFDGTNDYVAQTYDMSSMSEFSIEFWAKTYVLAGESNFFTGLAGPNKGGTYIRVNFQTNSTIGLLMYINGKEDDAFTSVTISYSEFDELGYNHYAYTIKDNEDMNIYFNGVLRRQTSIGSVMTTGLNSWYQRLGNYAGTYRWNGEISTCKFYGRKLTSSEILQNYNAQKDRFGL